VQGLIQSVYELSDGSGLILTVGKYVTPGKVDIDGNGIEPDFRSLPGKRTFPLTHLPLAKLFLLSHVLLEKKVVSNWLLHFLDRIA
jgi:C-terminal processing protease CtpA/Prc